MLNLRVTYTRPSADAPFFPADALFADWIPLLDSYAAQGKLLSRSSDRDTSAGKSLVLVIETSWRSVADNEEFIAEPLVSEVRDARIAHCNEHLIAVTIERDIVIDEFDTTA